MIPGAHRVGLTVVVVVLAMLAALAMWWRATTKPWTRDAQVRANIVGIAPRISGPIINFPVKDNQPVRKGDLLFEIDPATFQAALDSAQARYQQSVAKEIQAKQDLDRQNDLYSKKVTDLKQLQDAQDIYVGAVADVAAAQAEVETARLNLSYTKVFAPVDGYLTNVNTSPGTYVSGGEQLLALVDSSSFWVAAYFKETQLHHIEPGTRVRITLMGHERAPFEGVVEGVAWGIYIPDGSTVDLLPDVSQTIDWVRLPNRFPVRVTPKGQPPVPLRMGQTASVAVISSGNSPQKAAGAD
ncbi:MAG: HlyD family secretion protein [Terrimicrobiaceae bacterium]